MSTKSPLTRICIHCGAEFTRRSPFGRPPEYCTDAHRSAAFRDRVSRAAPVVPPEHDAAVERISESAVRRSQQLQRRTRTFDSLQRLEALKLYVALVQDIEDLGAVMARQAREYGASWEAIGDVLHISGDSARSRWSPGRVERVLEKRAKRGSSPRARRSAGDGADQGGPPGPAMAQALTDLQRGSGKSVRALARVINYSRRTSPGCSTVSAAPPGRSPRSSSSPATGIPNRSGPCGTGLTVAVGAAPPLSTTTSPRPPP
jgi:hypothetical protein